MEHPVPDNPNEPIETTKPAMQLQQMYYEQFGDSDWTKYDKDEHLFLKRNIGFALYGPPRDVDLNGTGYTKEQNKSIDGLYELTVKHQYNKDSSKILMSIVFVICVFENGTFEQQPVFVLKKCTGSPDGKNCRVFIDQEKRIYKSWQHFLDENKLPECMMIVPEDGCYSATVEDGDNLRVKLHIVQSPASRPGAKALQRTDKAGMIISAVATVPLVAAMIPGIIIAPAILAGAGVVSLTAGIYSAVRSGQSLIDRKEHGQGVGLKDSESRWCWLNIAANATSASAAVATHAIKVAVHGKNVSEGVRLSYDALEVAGTVLRTTSAAGSSYNMFDKIFSDNEEPSALEMFQYESSLLFYARSVPNFQSVELVTQTQQQILKDHEEAVRSSKYDRLLYRAQHATNEETVVSLHHIEDPSDFFAGLARIKRLNKQGTNFNVTPNGKYSINSAHIVDPCEFYKIEDENAVQISKPDPLSTDSLDFTLKHENYNILLNSNVDILSETAKDCVRSLHKNTSNVIVTFLLHKFDDYVAVKIIHILNETVLSLQAVFPDIVIKVEKMYPSVNIIVILLEFILYIIMKKGDTSEDFIKAVIESYFIAEGKVSTLLIKEIVDEFQEWLLHKYESHCVASKVSVERKRLDCKLCGGYYYC